jgi:hypothetical protein
MLKAAILAILTVVGFSSMDTAVADRTIRKDVLAATPDTLNWKLLGLIRYVKKPHKEYGEVNYPVVNAKLKSLNKKRVVMTGFIVPIDNEHYALSKNVFASCFFCGKAGPETIMGLKFVKPKRYRTDQYVTIEGVLRVNETNVDDWIYNIDQAVVVKGD